MIPHQFVISLASSPMNPTKDSETPEAVYHIQEINTDEDGNILTVDTGSTLESDVPAAALTALQTCFTNPDVLAYIDALTPNVD